jgi:hypothetical protein
MKASAKRRRSKAQIQEEKRAEELKQAELEAQARNFDLMVQQRDEMQERVEESQASISQVQSLIDNGLLTQGPNGQMRVVKDPAEQQRLREDRARERQAQAEASERERQRRRQSQVFGQAHQQEEEANPEDHEEME